MGTLFGFMFWMGKENRVISQRTKIEDTQDVPKRTSRGINFFQVYNKPETYLFLRFFFIIIPAILFAQNLIFNFIAGNFINFSIGLSNNLGTRLGYGVIISIGLVIIFSTSRSLNSPPTFSPVASKMRSGSALWASILISAIVYWRRNKSRITSIWNRSCRLISPDESFFLLLF